MMEARVRWSRITAWEGKKMGREIKRVAAGSPVTPAFATDAELIVHLVAVGDSSDQNPRHGRGGWKRADAEKFVQAGWAASMVSYAGANGEVVCKEPRDGG